MKKDKFKYSWYLHLQEECPHCGYVEGYAFSKKDQKSSNYPHIYDVGFMSRADLKRYCKENNIELVD